MQGFPASPEGLRGKYVGLFQEPAGTLTLVGTPNEAPFD